MSDELNIVTTCWKRLEDCHMFWHEADKNYFDPEKFRQFVQTYITTFRTVTFIIQKQKDNIPYFDTWYAKHRLDMQSDIIMEWLKNTRNDIEKKGDLQTNSLVRVELIASYFEKDYLVLDQNDQCLFFSFNQLLESAKTKLKNIDYINDGVFRISRRWVANTYAEEELLNLCSYGFQKLFLILKDLSSYLNVDYKLKNCEVTNLEIPQCLTCQRTIHSETYSVKDLHLIEAHAEKVISPAKRKEAAQKRYKELFKNKDAVKLELYGTKEEFVRDYFEKVIKPLFMHDGHHHTMFLLMKDGVQVGGPIRFKGNGIPKHLLMKEAAKVVAASSCNSIMYISESSHMEYDLLKIAPELKECLDLIYLDKEGTLIALNSDILRYGDQSNLGPTEMLPNFVPNILSAIYNMSPRSMQVCRIISAIASI
jgi:hypothetical protein